MTNPRLRRTAASVVLSTAVGALVVLTTRVLSGHDPAATLASTLGLRSGVVLGALLGGILGAWLTLGGARRVAATAGFLLGTAFLYGMWLIAEPALWVVDVVMEAVFGEGGEQYSGLVLFLIAFPLFRTIASAGTSLVGGVLDRQRNKPRRAKEGSLEQS